MCLFGWFFAPRLAAGYPQRTGGARHRQAVAAYDQHISPLVFTGSSEIKTALSPVNSTQS